MEFFIKLYNLYTMKSNLIVPIKKFLYLGDKNG